MEDHMLANFSTYLQFLDAVFISMLLKEIFSFWNPKFDRVYDEARTRMKERSGIVELFLKEPLDRVESITDKVSEEFYHSVSKRGAIMVFFTTLLLLFCGLETHLNISADAHIYRSWAISSFISFCYIAIILNRYRNNFSLVYLIYLIGPICLAVFFFFFEPITKLIINYKYIIILFIVVGFIIFLIRRRIKDNQNIWMNIYHNIYVLIFTIIPFYFSDDIVKWCEQTPLYFILFFCTWEVLWEWFLSFYYGHYYPDYIKNKINEAFSCVENKREEDGEVIKKEIDEKLKLTISEDEHHSKFYLFNLDVWTYSIKKFLNRVKNFISKFKKTKKREGIQIDNNKT